MSKKFMFIYYYMQKITANQNDKVKNELNIKSIFESEDNFNCSKKINIVMY